MSSFRKLFSFRQDGSESLFRETSFDGWLRFHIQSALRLKEPSPAAWQQIRQQLECGQPTAKPSLPRFAMPILPRHIMLILQVFFTEPELADRLDEQKMLLFTKMMPLPGPGVLGLAVT